MAAIAAAHRFALDRRIALEVVARHQPAGGTHGDDEFVGDRALVERPRSVAGDRRQGIGEIVLEQRVAGSEHAAVGFEKNLRR